MSEYCFSLTNAVCEDGINYALHRVLCSDLPVIVCVGTDATIGDALGPIIGTILQEKSAPAYVYGTLDKPVTAKEIEYIKNFLENTHPYSKILVVDAAVGRGTDVGLIKIFDGGLKPGLGANKNLPLIGDASVIGVVGEKALSGNELIFKIRLGAIYRFASVIANGICDYLFEITKAAEKVV